VWVPGLTERVPITSTVTGSASIGSSIDGGTANLRIMGDLKRRSLTSDTSKVSRVP